MAARTAWRAVKRAQAYLTVRRAREASTRRRCGQISSLSNGFMNYAGPGQSRSHRAHPGMLLPSLPRFLRLLSRNRGFRRLSGVAFLILCTSIQCASAADSNGNYAVWGIGARSCHTFNKSRESGETENYRNYVMGYLTAYNVVAQDTYRIAGELDLDQIMAWINDYCELKPINGFEQALADFTAEHASTRMKRAPSAYGR